MVALNTAYAPSETRTQPKNRVGNFFGGVAVRAGENRPATRNRIGEKRPTLTIIASGRPVWPNRDPLGEDWSSNLYRVLLNNLIHKIDYLGLVDADVWNGVDHWTGRRLPPDHPALRPDDPLFDVRDVLRSVCRATAQIGRSLCRTGAKAGCVVTCTSCNVLAPGCYALCIVSALFACELNYVGAVLLCNQI